LAAVCIDWVDFCSFTVVFSISTASSEDTIRRAGVNVRLLDDKCADNGQRHSITYSSLALTYTVSQQKDSNISVCSIARTHYSRFRSLDNGLRVLCFTGVIISFWYPHTNPRCSSDAHILGVILGRTHKTIIFYSPD